MNLILNYLRLPQNWIKLNRRPWSGTQVFQVKPIVRDEPVELENQGIDLFAGLEGIAPEQGWNRLEQDFDI